ncbi:uncharacterized protein AMSG_00165 [Thecamonas trahens ATCC 50062]|uniref:Uncharacterized protein n=1 Tax=Thecamonas trahens ATCC 50062 TaxID=461836 RepID=A0A0L0D1C4_THETB|nr:hypothetical protein AMSG_00165 [Thecamonas trahens ATCC 50062]KNC46047.1 hypothetical protein AMSG_00165 [Thecamonas trahens ATCC 50062]|eukprot:XP_013763027.1 hypothetical protein AMSG_00165 [Thecamonas trahens ATCC 50062]
MYAVETLSHKMFVDAYALADAARDRASDADYPLAAPLEVMDLEAPAHRGKPGLVLVALGHTASQHDICYQFDLHLRLQ